MDINIANRNAANLVPTGPVHPVTAPAVGGNKREDPLVSRAAAEPEATTRPGDGDNTELRAKHRGPGNDYTPEELAQLQDLRARDREVRAHEMAHLAVAGRHARGGASFSFESGPDGRRYAIAGEVTIDTSEVAGDPAATLAKAQQVRRAALAPANPSSQDRQIAAQAAAMAAQATAELARQRSQSNDETGNVTGETANQSYAVENSSDEFRVDLVA